MSPRLTLTVPTPAKQAVETGDFEALFKLIVAFGAPPVEPTPQLTPAYSGVKPLPPTENKPKLTVRV